jgi:hypothetical protein
VSIPQKLQSWEGKTVANFCHRARATHADFNNCVHFVCHALGVVDRGTSVPDYVSNMLRFLTRYPPSAWQQVHAAPGLAPVPTATTLSLIFVAPESSFQMRGDRVRTITGLDRHVGFYLGARVWHYENSFAPAPGRQIVATDLGNGHFYQRYNDPVIVQEESERAPCALYMCPVPNTPTGLMSYSEAVAHMQRVMGRAPLQPVPTP